MVRQIDPLVPNRILAFLENLKTWVLGKGFGMRELQESLSAQSQRI
jgi:hypothetical protein